VSHSGCLQWGWCLASTVIDVRAVRAAETLDLLPGHGGRAALVTCWYNSTVRVEYRRATSVLLSRHLRGGE
jgi:hypothetical protein